MTATTSTPGKLTTANITTKRQKTQTTTTTTPHNSSNNDGDNKNNNRNNYIDNNHHHNNNSTKFLVMNAILSLSYVLFLSIRPRREKESGKEEREIVQL